MRPALIASRSSASPSIPEWPRLRTVVKPLSRSSRANCAPSRTRLAGDSAIASTSPVAVDAARGLLFRRHDHVEQQVSVAVDESWLDQRDDSSGRLGMHGAPAVERRASVLLHHTVTLLQMTAQMKDHESDPDGNAACNVPGDSSAGSVRPEAALAAIAEGRIPIPILARAADFECALDAWSCYVVE